MSSNKKELIKIGKGAYKAIKEMVEALGTEDSAEYGEAQTAIQEDPLSIEVRSDWYPVGGQHDECAKPYEYCILLSTGGPATRIIGQLYEHCQPVTAQLQVQDWGTPWTDYTKADESVLLAYASQFYFGE